MSTYRLDRLFSPRSIAVVGASPRERSVGRMILRNLREAGFAGSIGLVNPKYPEIEGIRAVGNVADLSAAPDLCFGERSGPVAEPGGDDDRGEISVADSGSGIAPEMTRQTVFRW
jgi:CoA binding domain